MKKHKKISMVATIVLIVALLASAACADKPSSQFEIQAVRERIAFDSGQADSYIYGGRDIRFYNDDHTTETGRIDSEGGWKVAAPTAIATATPALLVDSLGVSVLFEVRDAATPVVQIPDGGGLNVLVGAVDIDTTLNVDGAVTFNSTLDVDGNVTSGTGAFTVTDQLNVTLAVDFDTTLNVDGATTIGGLLTVNDSVVVTGDVDVDTNVQITGTLDVDGATTLNDTLEVNGVITLEQDETISNATDGWVTITLPSGGFLDIAVGNLSVGDGVPDDTQDGEDAYVEGTLEVDGNVNFDGTLDVLNATTLNSTLEVNGNITLENDETISNADDKFVTITVPATGHLGVATGNLQIGDGVADSTLNGEDAYIVGLLEVDGAVDLDSTLNVEDAVTLQSTLEVNGDITLENDEIISNANDKFVTVTVPSDGHLGVATGNLQIGDGVSDLTIDGEDAYIVGQLEVDGAVRLDSTLEVNGLITLENDETISNATDGWVTITLPSGGFLDIAVGNLSVGDGVPDDTQDGEDAYIEGTLEVDGNVNFDGALNVLSGITFQGNLQVDGTTTLNSTLEVNGDITLEKDETISNATDGWITVTLPATGSLDITVGNLRVGDGASTVAMTGEDAYVEGTFEVDGAVRFDSTLEVNGDITLENDETIANSLDKFITITVPSDGFVDIATGNLSVGDGVPDGTMDGEDGYVEGIFEVDGAVRFDSTLEVNGVITLEQDETIDNSVDGWVTVTLPSGGFLDVAVGNLSVGDGVPNDTQDGEDAYIEGTLEVDGNVNFDGTLDVLNATTLNSTLEVNGTITLENDETIANSLDKFITITLPSDGFVDIAVGNLSVGDGTPDDTQNGEDMYVEGTLEVDGNANFDGTFNVEDAVTFQSTLDVYGGISSSEGGITVTDNLTVAGGFTVTDNVLITGTLDVDGDLLLEDVLTFGVTVHTEVGNFTLNPTRTLSILNPGSTLTLTLGTSGVSNGDQLELVNIAGQNVVILTTNLYWSGAYTMTQYDTMLLVFYSSNWYELSRSVNS